MPPGHVFFGDYFHAGFRDLPLVQALMSPDNEELFAKPQDWKRVWKKKSGTKNDLIMVWRAVPPSTDYVTLGDVCDRNIRGKPMYKDPPTVLQGSEEGKKSRVPELETFRCVHKALLVEKPLGQQMWNDKGTWGSNGGVWAAPPPGNFFIFNEHNRNAPQTVRMPVTQIL